MGASVRPTPLPDSYDEFQRQRALPDSHAAFHAAQMPDSYESWKAAQTPQATPAWMSEENARHPVSPEQPGILARAGSAIGDWASDVYHNPSHLATGMLAPFVNVATVPMDGRDAQHPSMAEEGMAGKMGINLQNPAPEQRRFVDPGTRQSARELARNAGEAGVQIAAGKVGGAIASRLEPRLGAVGSEIIGGTSANAAAGAAQNPTDPVVGAITGATTGEVLHRAAGVVKPIARIVQPRSAGVGDVAVSHEVPVTQDAAPATDIRASGPALSPEQAHAVTVGAQELFTDPNAGLVAQGGPKAVAAQRIAAANAASQMPEFARQQAQAATAHLTPPQQQQFTARIVQDNLEAEATRKAASDPDASQKARAHAAEIAQSIPEGIEDEPWFQKALSGAKSRVLPVTEGLAPEAGVNPETFRRPSLGLYTKLVPQERLAPDAQAPIDNAGTRRPSVKVAGSANAFTGDAGSYATDSYPELAARDAQDKAVSAARNRVFQAVAATGREIPSRAEADPAHERVFAFNNRNEIVDVPSKGNEDGARLFAIPNDVADAVDRYRATSAPLPNAAQKLSNAAGIVTKAALLNPVVAPMHALRAAGSLGSTGTGNLATDAAMGFVPGLKSGVTLARALHLDPSDPAYIEADRRAVLAGGSRVQPKADGLLNVGHNWLFGPNGADRRLRVLGTMDYTADRATKGLSTEGAEYDAGLRSYLTQHLGDYVGKNRGSVLQAIRTIAPFAPMHTAGAVTGAKALVGSGGLSEPTTAQRVGTVLRSPLGAIAGSAAATYALTGHGPSGNGPDRETAVGTPLYDVPGKTMPQYARGDSAVAALPPGSRQYSVRNPGESVIARAMAPLIYGRDGDKLAGAGREVKNFAGSYLGPAAQLVAGAAGAKTYFGTNDKTPDEKTTSLSLDAQAGSRIRTALANASAAGALVPGSPSTRSLTSALLPMVAEGSPNQTVHDLKSRVQDYTTSKLSDVYRAKGDPTKAQGIVDDAMKELDAFKDADGQPIAPRQRAKIYKSFMRAMNSNAPPKPFFATP